MGSFEVCWKRSAAQDLRKLDRALIRRTIDVVDSLAIVPQAEGSRKLKGTRGHYRIRIGDYRLIYEVEAEAKIVTVHYVRHRKDAYRPRR